MRCLRRLRPTALTRAAAIGVALCSAFVLIACSAPTGEVPSGNQQGLVSASLGAAHALAAPVNGSNLDYSGVGQAFSPDTLTIMTAFHSGTLRYPGGAISNYWTWQTGSVDHPAQTAGTPGRKKTKPGVVRDYGFKLSTLQRIVAETGTTPIFDLNVLTSNLADQLAMLRSASALGIPMRYIELGNEFYLSDTNYTRVFPTSADYAGLVTKWAPRIRAAFTDVKIAAVGSLPQVTPREKIWNATVLSIAGPDIDALTLHDYAGLPKSTGTPGQGGCKIGNSVSA